MGSKSGVCYRKCRDFGDCNDENAECTEDGYCAPANWQGWPEDDSDTDTDTDENSDEGSVSDDDGISADDSDGGEEQADDSEPEKKKKSGGCSAVLM